MNLLFQIKAAIMNSIMERQKAKPFDATVSDLFKLTPEMDDMVNNSYFFGGDSLDGESIKMRLGQRNNGYSEVFVIYIGKDGRYVATDKQLYKTEECPLKVTCLIPGRDYNVQFDGELVDMNSGERIHCSYNINYTSRLPVFCPPKDAYLMGMAQSFARQSWNKKFFKSLAGDTGVGDGKKNVKQMHYEQTGKLDGQIKLGDKDIQLSLAGIRDRAYGRRDWNYMNNHMWLVAVTGRGEVLNLSIVSYPHAKNLYCGYTDIASDRNHALTGYKIISFDYNDGKGPDELVIYCSFDNGKTYRLKAVRTHDLITPFDNGNFYFHEAVGKFDIGGVEARGTIELGFNKDQSRWVPYELD